MINMKKGRKKYIIILIILVIYFVVLFMMFYNKKEKTISIVVDNYALFNYTKKDKWKNIPLNNDKLDLYNWQNYNVYIDKSFNGNKYLWFNDKWYIFNKDKSPINYYGSLFAIHTDFDYSLEPINFEEQNINNYSYVYDVLKDNNIKIDNNYTVNSYLLLDIDNDGTEEEFYTISNSLPIDFTASKYYSFVFMVKNNKVYYLYKDTYDEMFDACKPYISGILDVDNDKNYEIIVNCGKYSNKGANVNLYKFNKKVFEKVVSNE